MEDWQHGGFGLYIHWPFCQSKCPYCDFNSHVSGAVDQRRWEKAYLSEIDRIGRETEGRTLDTVFFGGGTPSLMDPDVVSALVERIRQTWRTSNSFEVSLEANPGSVDAARFRGFADAGINRLSMGVQALDDRSLKALGRLHTADEARIAFDIARKSFDRVSFDLIYARQDQTLTDWKSELSEALSMAVDHLSLYQLTIEPGTAFGARYDAGRLRGLPDDVLSADMYDMTQDICGDAGMPAYEVSNHARDGSESRHNRIYWSYGDYAGVGPGAHGRLTLAGRKWATETVLAPDRWLEQVEESGSGELPRRDIAPEDQADEYMIMGLRLAEGVSRARFEALRGRRLDDDRIDHLTEIGVVKIEGDRIRTTADGRKLLNSVLAELLVET